MVAWTAGLERVHIFWFDPKTERFLVLGNPTRCIALL
jgi:hypothetical protein